MLSLEDQIIDATTEEGQAALKEFEEQERQDRVAAQGSGTGSGLVQQVR